MEWQSRCKSQLWLLTHVELAEELQPCVALRRGQSGRPVSLVQVQDGFLHVPLSHHPVPLVVVEGRVGVHGQLHGTVAHVEGEGDDLWSCGHKAGGDNRRSDGFQANVHLQLWTELIPLAVDKPKKSWFLQDIKC